MLEAIQKLLLLQERDRKILRIREELDHLPFEKEGIQSMHATAKKQLDEAQLTGKKLETERHELEVEVQTKNQLIEKYSLQQFETKKNEEYSALAKEITNCKSAIVKIEDHQLELMEKIEINEKHIQEIKVTEAEAKKNCDDRMVDLNKREQELSADLTTLESDREDLAVGVDNVTLSRYERLLVNKGNSVVVGIEHGACGGCHMQLSRQVIVSCQGGQELMTCQQCGRLLYFTPTMDLAPSE